MIPLISLISLIFLISLISLISMILQPIWWMDGPPPWFSIMEISQERSNRWKQQLFMVYIVQCYKGWGQGRIWGGSGHRWNPLGSRGGPGEPPADLGQKKFCIACSSNWRSATFITFMEYLHNFFLFPQCI